MFPNNVDNEKLEKTISDIGNLTPSPKIIDNVTSQITDLLLDSANKTFKPKTFEQNDNKPWFGPKCHQMRKKYHVARANYRKLKSTVNKTRLNVASREYKKTMIHYINKHIDNTTNKLRQMKSKDPKKYWKLLRKNKNRNNTKTSMPTINEFYEHFKNVNKNDDPSVDNSQSFYNNDSDFNDTILNSHITTDEILKCIANLKNSKTPSKTDNILNEYIKSTKDRLLPVYVFLFNAILDTGHMPETWLSGTIYPIYKGKGQSSEPNNYRPIPILSCLGKLFTAILNNRINIFLEENNLLKENQAGLDSEKAMLAHTTYSP